MVAMYLNDGDSEAGVSNIGTEALETRRVFDSPDPRFTPPVCYENGTVVRLHSVVVLASQEVSDFFLKSFFLTLSLI